MIIVLGLTLFVSLLAIVAVACGYLYRDAIRAAVEIDNENVGSLD